MKKLLQLLFVLVLFSGCLSEQDKVNIWKDKLPLSAVVIKSYDNGRWVKWKFEDQCFLTKLYGEEGLSMRMDCNE